MREKIDILYDMMLACNGQRMTHICETVNINQTRFKELMPILIKNGSVVCHNQKYSITPAGREITKEIQNLQNKINGKT